MNRADRPRTVRFSGNEPSIPHATIQRLSGRIRAWMLVLPADFFLLLSPCIWTPQQWKASVTMAALSLLVFTGAGGYRARLHLSVLDELPSLLSKLLTAAALVATVIALRHEQSSVETFLRNGAISIALAITGRLVINHVIMWSRRRRLTVHPTVLVGGGSLARELAEILARWPRYGLCVVGFVDDDPDPPAAVTRKLGGPANLDAIVRRTQADVLMIADGACSERELLDMVRTPACLPCDLLIVPRTHHFHTQTGLADHIGSIPIMHIRTPNLRPGTGHQAGVRHRRRQHRAACRPARARFLRAGCAPGGRPRRHLPTGPGGAERQAVQLPEVPHDEPPQRCGVGHPPVHRRGRPRGHGRALPAPHLAGRVAAAVEHPLGRHGARGPPSGAAVLRRAVLGDLRPVRPSPSRPGRAHRLRPGQRSARGHSHRRPRQLRQLLHRELVALARREDPHPHRHPGPQRPRRLVPRRIPGSMAHRMDRPRISGAPRHLSTGTVHPSRRPSGRVPTRYPEVSRMRFRASPVVRLLSDRFASQSVEGERRWSGLPSESTMSAERDLMEIAPTTVIAGRRLPVYHDRPPRLGPMLLWRTSCRLYRRGSFRLAKILKGVSFLLFRAILPPEATLGRDVRMEHYGLNVMIHPNTVIGDRCRIYQGVTVASSANIGSDDRVLIGSDVLIGAGATILNRYGRTLRIGDGCRIGVKALVVDDLPPGAVVRAPVGEVISPEAER